MKLLFLLSLLFIHSLYAQSEMKIMSFNTMCKLCDIKRNYGPFDERIEHIVETIKRFNPDLVSLQEVQNRHHALLISNLLNDQYEILYRKFWAWPGTDSLLLIKKERFKIIEHFGSWLGPKAPHFSFGWKFRAPRKVEFAHLLDNQTNKELLFVGAHFDNNFLNKKMSVEYINNIISHYNLPVIFAGDTNIRAHDELYEHFLGSRFQDSFSASPQIDLVANTPYREDDVCSDGKFPDCRVDHILFSNNFGIAVKSWMADLYRYYNDMFVSDHRAVGTVLTID